MQDSKNMILAVVLSMLVLFGWQYFIVAPKQDLIAQQALIDAQTANPENLDLPTASGVTATGVNPASAASPAVTFETASEALAATARVVIKTPAVTGSINLVGARLDDLHLNDYRETVDPTSPTITLLSPSTAPNGYYIEQGWVSTGEDVNLPDAKTAWSVDGNGTLTPTTPVTVKWDNGAGLIFRRTFVIDEHYLFTVTQSIENTSSADVSLLPYSRSVRLGTPDVENFFVLHEGPIGVLGEENLIEQKYSDLQDERQIDVDSEGGWLGFTDKYWATAVIPDSSANVSARLSWKKPTSTDVYQASFVNQTPVIAAAGKVSDYKSYVFAGAKVESVLADYEATYGFDRLELLIDWGWFHFLTKPMFKVIRYLNSVLGNFGLAILAVTVIVKALFFPLANKSYASMAAMRRVQPEMKALQERNKDDKAAQQKEMMELYKREKINPISGCWPMLIQIPVFFSLYKTLFVTIEMRHAPFFGWIKDLAAQDPTNIFNLFGLLPYDPTALPVIGGFLALGIWPVIMGITMWVQMKLNPPPTDPSQAMIFAFMPIIFTFMLGTFPAGLVIYWAWNNLLSVTQQYIIMKRHGVTVDLLGNILASFKRKPKPDDTK